jgi:outer membrane receptor for ferrienterochelin and colicins
MAGGFVRSRSPATSGTATRNLRTLREIARRRCALPLIAIFALALPPRTGAARQTAPVDDPSELSSLSLEELMQVDTVVTAGRHEQTVRQAAASVSVVTADEIDLMGYRNLAELLRNQRSFFLHTDGLNWFAGVRGFLRPGEWNARLLLLIDGRPTRENIYGQTHLDQDFPLPIEAYKRVEIVRGPASALYGNNAVFGVVNAITKDGADLNGAYVRLQGGMHDTARIMAMYGLKTKDGLDVLAGASGFTTEGEDSIRFDGISDPELNFGRVEGWDGERTFAGFVKVKYGDLTLMVNHADRDRQNRSATYYASFFNPGTQRELRTDVTLSLDHEISPTQRIHAMVYYGRYFYDQNIGYAIDPTVGPETYSYFSEADDDWLGQEVHYDWQVTPRLRLLVGAEATQSLSATQHDHDDFGFDIEIDGSYYSWGTFGEVSWQALDRLTLVAGGRYDYVYDVGGQLSPRAGAIVNVTSADTVKLLYGRAFRAPNLYERTYDVGGGTGYAANPDLKHEVVDTYELIWEREFKSGWRTSVGGFLWRMSDALNDVTLDDGRSQTQNTGTVEARGVEVELGRRWESGGSLRTYATYTQTENDDGDRLFLSPEWTAGVAVTVPVIGKHTFLSIDSQAVGPMLNDLGDSTDPSFVTNVVLTSRRFFGVEHLEFQAGVYNLFADDARLPSGGSAVHAQPTLNWPEPRAMVGMTYRF